MRIYFSGIGGVGIGPLAKIACDVGHDVLGSDIQSGPFTDTLSEKGVLVSFDQSGTFLEQAHRETPIDLFIYTSALPDTHPELVFAREHAIPVGKRDSLLAQILREKSLKLIAVSGTHGKTTTTSLLVWTLQQLGLPASYSVGTALTFASSGKYDKDSEYFIYECDEYDRNMLHFEPYLTIITSLDYDHPDTYKNEHVYKSAFVQFMEQSHQTLLWEKDLRYLARPDVAASYEAYDEHMDLSRFTLYGTHVRQNAFLVARCIQQLLPDVDKDRVVSAINAFPGSGRRFEKLAENLYSDYGHHPAEIAATLQLASELNEHIVLVYQPHQNVRQHEVRADYTDTIFEKAEEVYWLPTYLSREDPSLEILTPEQLTRQMNEHSKIHAADVGEALWDNMCRHRDAGHLVLVMGAGNIDQWVRNQESIRRSAEVLVIDTNGNFVMQHRDDIPTITNPGLLTSFGGSAEPEENIRAAAARELSEETNLTFSSSDLCYLATLWQETVADGTSRWTTYFTLENVTTDKFEIHEGQGYKIVTPAEKSSLPLSALAQKATSIYLEQRADTK